MYLINGHYSETVPAQDRGLHYGDGVFETIAIQDGKLLCWDEHYQRLQTGCDRLGFPCPAAALLRAEANRLPVTGPRCVVKIIVTRGTGGRGYCPPDPAATTPTRIVACYPWPDIPQAYASDGVKLCICTTRLGGSPQLAGIKHLNRLEQVLARSEWTDPAIAEGLMLDINDVVIEGTMSNLFGVNGNTLFTPDLGMNGVAGIIRGCVLKMSAQLNLRTSIQAITLTELFSMHEIFLCNSVIGIWPVREIGHKKFAVGPRTKEIRNLLLHADKIAI